jgi:hypothetical protein
MATLFTDEPFRSLQHGSVLIAQHAIWTTYDLLSHLAGPFLRFARRIRQAKRKLASDARAAPPPWLGRILNSSTVTSESSTV